MSRLKLVCQIVDDTPVSEAEEGVRMLRYQPFKHTKLVCQIVDSENRVEGFGNLYNYSAYNFTVLVLVLLLIILLYKRYNRAD